MNRDDCTSDDIQLSPPIVNAPEGHIMQPNAWSCFACTAAMATGTTLQDVIDFLGFDGSEPHEKSNHVNNARGFYMKDIIPYLAKHNCMLGIWLDYEDGMVGMKASTLAACRAGPAILDVESPLAQKLGYDVSHSVYFTPPNTVWDPMKPWPCELDDYKVKTWYPLVDITPLIDPNFDPSKGGGGG